MRTRNVVRPWKANCKFVRGLGGWAFLSENNGSWDTIAFLPAVGLPTVLPKALLTKNDRDRLKKYFHGTILGRFPTVPSDIKRCVAYHCKTASSANELEGGGGKLKKVGECKFSGHYCSVYAAQYHSNQRIALVLHDKSDGEKVATATVNLPDDDIDDGYVFIKNYSENVGIMEALIEAKIIGPPISSVSSAYVQIAVCKLLVEV